MFHSFTPLSHQNKRRNIILIPEAIDTIIFYNFILAQRPQCRNFFFFFIYRKFQSRNMRNRRPHQARLLQEQQKSFQRCSRNNTEGRVP